MLYQHNPTGLRLSKSVVAGLALALFPMGFQTLQAQPTATVSISPANPTTDDHVVAHLSGNWPDSCAPGSVLPPHFTSGAHQFSIQFVAGNGGCAICWSFSRLTTGTSSRRAPSISSSSPGTGSTS
jgi:hypothetical protein